MADNSTSADDNSTQQNKYKRKRKENFLKRARKYGKKGSYGRGSELDSETYQYFVRILEVYKEGFPSEEEKSIFVNNVFQQTEKEEIKYSSNQIGCRVIQMLLPFASSQWLERYMDAFSSNVRPLCSDRFASHVMQTLLEVACKKSKQEDIADDFKEKYQNFTLKISKFLLNNLEDYVWDTYGNHIIRTVFRSLAQLPLEDEKQQKHVTSKIEEDETSEVPEEYAEVIKDYAQRLITWPQFKDLPYSEITSGALQILLKALVKLDRKQLKAYIKKLLNESFASDTEQTEESEGKEMVQANKLPDVFMSKPAIMLMETALEVAPRKLYTQIYAKCFINHLPSLAKTRNTNFPVQKLLNHCKEKIEFEAMFDELADHFHDILEAGHSGVILSLGQACKRLSAKQGSFVQNIMKAFNCFEREENQANIVMCLCKFVKFEDLEHEKSQDLQFARLNLHGTLLVQLMLEFNKPIKIVNSILNMDTADLKNIFCNRNGCHVADSYVKGQFVGEKSRERLLRKMQGTYQDLASSRYGSRSFDAMWNVASLKYRGIIMGELAHKDAAWSNSEFGKIIANKVHLFVYKRSKEEWQNSFDLGSKKQALFADIIGS